MLLAGAAATQSPTQPQLFRALERADSDPPPRTAAPLIRELEVLTREPLDDAVAVAAMPR